MQVAQLALPARYAAGIHFKQCYGPAQFAADNLARKFASADGTLNPDVTREDSKLLVKLLQESLCAARALDSILAGNPPPRRGD